MSQLFGLQAQILAVESASRGWNEQQPLPDVMCCFLDTLNHYMAMDKEVEMAPGLAQMQNRLKLVEISFDSIQPNLDTGREIIHHHILEL
jgi:hypothetical protein